LEKLKAANAYEQKDLMVALVKDVITATLGIPDSQHVDSENTFAVRNTIIIKKKSFLFLTKQHSN
jgi:hypothetical protein